MIINPKEGYAVVHKKEMTDALLSAIANDKKAAVKGQVYYEVARKLSADEGQVVVNCIDAGDMYVAVERQYKSQGLHIGEPRPVEVAGHKFEMLVLRHPDESKHFADYFGLAAGYMQAQNEIVMYMYNHK